MKLFFVATIVFAGLLTFAAAAAEEQENPILSFLRVATKLSAESKEALRENNIGIQLTGLSGMTLQCADAARNASLWPDDCNRLFSSFDKFTDTLTAFGGGVNATVIDNTCRSRCFQKFSIMFQTWRQCMRSSAPTRATTAAAAVPSTTAARIFSADDQQEEQDEIRSISIPTQTTDPNVCGQAVLDMMGEIMNYYCQQNNAGTYCLVAIQSMSATMSAAPSSQQGGDLSTVDLTPICNAVQTSGCCVGGYFNPVNNIMSGPLFTESTAQVSAAMNAIQTSLQQSCSVTIGGSCTPNPASAPKLTGVARLSLGWSWWNSQSAERQELIKTALCTDIAAAAGIYATQCSITSVSQASGSSRRLLQSASSNTAFNYQLVSNSVTALESVRSSLSAVQFTDVSQAAGVPVTGSSTVQAVVASPANSASSLAANLLMVLLAGIVAVVAAL